MTTLAGPGKSLMIKGLFPFFTIGLIIIISCSGPSADSGSKLEAGFKNPPESAKPRIWWHWMNGNITKEGIKADLEWMKRVGIGGFQSFDADISTPQIVRQRLIYMTPEWKDAFLYSARLADSLGLEMAIAGSPGWSESGGPWVTPDRAMKKLVWSKIRVAGGQPFTGDLPKPPATTGTFQNIEDRKAERSASLPEYYADVAVLAFRVSENDIPIARLKPEITSSGGHFDINTLSDGNLAYGSFLPAAPPNGKSWIQFKFPRPETIQSVTIVAKDRGGELGRVLETSDNGLQFRKVTEIKEGQSAQSTVTFPPVKSRFFRITFATPASMPYNTGPDGSVKGRSVIPEGVLIAELDLHTVARVNRFEDKAGFSSCKDLYSLATPAIPAADAIRRKDVIDLTSKMKSDGKFEWTPPAGNWVILRLGYSLTGKNNHPASPEATGLEVDKLNAASVKYYFENYLDQYKSATKGLMGKRGLHYVITDSWEAGVQNWTDSMIIEFSRRRGYSMLPWLPALTGQIVESAEASDRFLWDFRKTISDLTAENHYDQLTTILRSRDMERYSESHEGGRAFIADGMEVKRKASIPMSALWTPNNVGGIINTGYMADVRESASVAHIYGQELVAVESMTSYGSPWAWSPEFLKPTADMELACGANRFVQSVSVHSPADDKLPGLSLGPFGPWLNRHETWAEQAQPWMTYLSRSSFMLQQGKNVADVIYYYGDDNNITSLFAKKLPDIPSGYNYDFVNSDAILTNLDVKEGQIVTPGGINYKFLALDSNCRYMTLPVLRKISALVKAGAIIVGDKPGSTPSLSDDQNDFMAIANELWPKEKGENAIGNGKVYAGYSIAEVLGLLKIGPDFSYTRPHDDTELLFVHHELNDIDIYWINNRNNRTETAKAVFRVDKRVPEIWHPETGEIEDASYSISDGRTEIPLRLDPEDAIFVVFRKRAVKTSVTVARPVENHLALIDGPWDLNFQPGRGAPSGIVADKLTSWSQNSDPGIKYFSGTGTYTKVIQAPAGWFKEDQQLWLDLGDVKNLAEVIVNGKSQGIVWKMPFRVNLTGQIKQGENRLEVKITNLWVNRLIGDQQPGVTKKITYTSEPYYSAGSTLMPAGLMGPVIITGLSKN